MKSVDDCESVWGSGRPSSERSMCKGFRGCGMGHLNNCSQCTENGGWGGTGITYETRTEAGAGKDFDFFHKRQG